MPTVAPTSTATLRANHLDSRKTRTGSENALPVPEIDVEQFAALHNSGSTVIDVRMPDEYESGHVPGARLIPLPELPDRISEVPVGEPVYFVCAGGGRSRKAAEYLAAQGIDATNVAGGTKAWIESGKPTNTGTEP